MNSNTKSIQIKICTYFHDAFASFSSLQAALCLEYDDRPENYLVEYATTMISDGLNGAKYALVEDVIYHENFDPEKMNDDIGLIKLQAPMQLFSAGWRVKLPLRNEYFPTGTPAVLAGDNFITSRLFLPLITETRESVKIITTT